jgi:hypothetical protein
MLEPIRVEPCQKTNTMDPMARLNYLKVYPVEHNVKVYDFGMVHKDHRHVFRKQFEDVRKAVEVAADVSDDENEDGEDDGDGIEGDNIDEDGDNEDDGTGRGEAETPRLPGTSTYQRYESSSRGEETSTKAAKESKRGASVLRKRHGKK